MTITSKYDLDEEVRVGGRRGYVRHIDIKAARSCYFRKDTCAIKYQVELLISDKWELLDFWEDEID